MRNITNCVLLVYLVQVDGSEVFGRINLPNVTRVVDDISCTYETVHLEGIFGKNWRVSTLLFDICQEHPEVLIVSSHTV